jgi:membrane protease YdiL (CAAX protease family)
VNLVNVLIATVWGGLTLWAWTTVLLRSRRSWRLRHDPRSIREFRFIGILWICAVIFTLTLLVATFIPDTQTARAALFGLFCGMFTVAGATLALSEEER